VGLTKIELIGFKSFADKEVIVFEKGVTGIVGPNGCGKSNVSDAIRWVIGETSAKQIRGSSMQDVIFNGTENRKSQSFCEVSLFFDNKERQFPNLPFEEVIFTRKLYKSGESCYFINREQARLRDIVNNFHDVGVSKDGYSIIGQGKVSDIMSSKPEDRRAIFEEAVGIAKTKKEKNDSQRSLERAKDSIRQHAIRVADIEKRLAPKAAAAEKTIEYNKLSEELKFHEINTYISNYESANGKKEVINQRIAVINEQMAQLTTSLNETQYNYNSHSAEINEADGDIARVNAKILEKSIGITQKEGDMKLFNERIGFLNAEIDRLVKENTNARFEIENLIGEDKSLNEKKVECEKNISILNEKISAINVKINALSLKINESELEQESAQNKALQSAENLAKIMQSIGSLEAEQSVLSERQRETVQKVTELKEKFREESIKKQKIEQELAEKETKLSAYRKKSEDKEQEVAEIDTRLEELADKLYTLNTELAGMQSKYNVYAHIKETYEGYNAVVQRLMKDAKVDKTLSSKIKGVVASVISTKREYEVAIETALGAATQNIITQTPDDAKYILEYLKRNKAGRLTCLPITSVKPRVNALDTKDACSERGAIGLATDLVEFDDEYESVVRFLLGNTLICQDNDSALLIAKRYRFGFKIVTLDGQVYSPNGSMTGGSAKQAQSSLLSVENQVTQMEKSIGVKSREMIALKQRKDQLALKSETLLAELNTINESMGAVKQEVADLKERLAVAISNCENIERDLSGYTEAVKILNERLESITNKFSDAEKGNEKLQAERQALSGETQKQKESIDSVKRERETLIDERSGYQSDLAKYSQELVGIEAELTRVATTIANTKERIVKNNENISADNDIIANIKSDADKKALSQEEQAELESLRQELSALEERKKTLAELVKEDEAKRQELSEKISASVEKKHKEEEGLIKIDTDLEYLQERVYTSYGVDYEQCKEFKVEEYDLDNGAQEIRRLRTRINFLGPINPTAPEEYEQENTEYLTLLAQKEDMEKAASDLDQAVKVLSEEMTKQFNKGFGQIREYFKTIFKVLFGGGDADLIIEEVAEGEDPLDAGIEIKAQPPGKSLKSISLLSGGEQALTAIAILFAILKLRPLPFCVLDEIEAPLDDANVARFANYLKKFSEETQFIVITHKKPTMERADALYGVTMPEKGISKTVSVKLTDVDKIDLK